MILERRGMLSRASARLIGDHSGVSVAAGAWIAVVADEARLGR